MKTPGNKNNNIIDKRDKKNYKKMLAKGRLQTWSKVR